MSLIKVLVTTLGNMAQTGLDAAAQRQPSAPSGGGRRRRQRDQNACVPCMARGAAVEARAAVAETRKRVRQGAF